MNYGRRFMTLYRRQGSRPFPHAKMGTIKDRKSMDLREEEDIKKSWQEYAEELYKKILMIRITTMMCSLT